MSDSNLFSLEDRAAVVTGGGGKLGPIWCRALLEAGAKVAAIDLSATAAQRCLTDLLEAHRGRLQILEADVTDRASLEVVRDRIEASLGPVRVLVNNAGIDQPPGAPARTHLLEDLPLEAARKVLEVNLLGLFLATQVFLPSLRRAGGGSVVNIGSLYGHVSPDARLYDHIPVSPPFLKPPLYGASKAGVSSLTRYLATHLARDGVRVNTLCPGGVLGGQDPQFLEKFSARVPLGRLADADDLRGPLLFLASEASRYVTGQDLIIDGGFTAW